MSPEIQKLAEKIADLDPKAQEVLLETVAQISYKRGLHKLSVKYKERLKKENKLNEGKEDILAKLRQTRAEIASKTYASEDN